MLEPEAVQRQRALLRNFRRTSAQRLEAEIKAEDRYRTTCERLETALHKTRKDVEQEIDEIRAARTGVSAHLRSAGLEYLLQQQDVSDPPTIHFHNDLSQELSQHVAQADNLHTEIIANVHQFKVARSRAAKVRIFVLLGLLLFVIIVILIWAQKRRAAEAHAAATVTAEARAAIATATAEARAAIAAATAEAHGLELVYVPEGEFTMGSDDGALNERPIHNVYLDSFQSTRTEVTNAQYARCVGAGVCTPPNNSIWDDMRFADYPVVNVTWDQANTYAKWVGGRLPTEAEWEKACRGTDMRPYPWGNADPSPELLNFQDSGIGGTAPVGSYPAGVSPYGVLDMAGNVWEWTADWYNADYYNLSPDKNPTGPDSGRYRVVRGGSYQSPRTRVRCTYRYGLNPRSQSSSHDFRVVSTGSLSRP